MSTRPALGAACILMLLACSSLAHSEDTTPGDPTAGRRHFGVCTACHGTQAEGNRALAAPALAGREDWYLHQQLQNFRSGVRGADPRDTAGQTMRPMAQMLPDEQAIRDLVAYIVSLERKEKN